MKRAFLTVITFVLCMAGVYAQSGEQGIKQFPPFEKKSLDLEYLGSDSSSVLERIQKKDTGSLYLQKPEKQDAKLDEEGVPKASMPIMQPDTSIHYPILTLKPDSTVLYHLQIRKPE